MLKRHPNPQSLTSNFVVVVLAMAEFVVLFPAPFRLIAGLSLVLAAK